MHFESRSFHFSAVAVAGAWAWALSVSVLLPCLALDRRVCKCLVAGLGVSPTINLAVVIAAVAVCFLFSSFCHVLTLDPVATAGGTTFAFIEYDDNRDAEDAVRDRDGYKFDGTRLRVEIARGGRRGGPDDRRGGGAGEGRSGGHGPPQRTDFKVVVENLPPNTSWQDLKDHMRKAGEVGFAEVTRGGSFAARSVPSSC